MGKMSTTSDKTEEKVEKSEVKEVKFKLTKEGYMKKLEEKSGPLINHVLNAIEQNLPNNEKKAVFACTNKITLHVIENDNSMFKRFINSDFLQKKVIALVKERKIIEGDIKLEWNKYYENDEEPDKFWRIELDAIMFTVEDDEEETKMTNKEKKK